MEASRPAPTAALTFEAAVERPLSVAYRTAEGRWEGHDFRVEVIATRQGLDGFDVVVDFRDLEAALDALLEPLRGRLLEDMDLRDPQELARMLAEKLAQKVPPPARLAEIALTDGQGRRLAYRP